MKDSKRKRYSEAFKKEAVMRGAKHLHTQQESWVLATHFKQIGQKV